MATEKELLEAILNMVKKTEEPKMLKRFTNYTKTLVMSFEDLGIDLTVSFIDGKGTVEKGTAPEPNMTVRTDTRTIIDILGGNLSAMRAFMSGKIKADGPAREPDEITALIEGII